MKPKQAQAPETLGELLDELSTIRAFSKNEMEVLSEVLAMARLMKNAKNIGSAAAMWPDFVKAVERYEAVPAFKIIRVPHE